MRLHKILLAAPLAGALLYPAIPAMAAGTGATMASGDMDGDGFEDVVALDAGHATVSIITLDAQGEFTAHTQDYPDMPGMTALTLADVDGDGRLDVLVSDATDAASGVRVLLNTGGTGLAADVAYASGEAGPGPVSLTAADLNGDGFVDIVTAGGSAGTVSVLLNHGDGSFAAPVSYTVGGDITAVAVADFNGDGFPDIVASDTAGDGVVSLPGAGDGSFGAPLTFMVGAGPVALTATDVNGDGFQDLLVADRDDDSVGVLLGLGDGSFAAPAFYPTGSQPGWIGTADLDGDGLADLVTDNYSDGSVSLFANQGGGAFEAPQQLFLDYGSYGTLIMSIGGKPQIVSANLDAGVVVVTAGSAVHASSKPPRSQVHRIGGTHDPQSSNGGGALDLFSLGLLAAFALRRRVRG
ncbi:MAG TPA: VCBS repeat-containing protein [Gammaproteobacteria bacterium]|nr:VCBS repeat-containing protein [Gammaproteobacteria bacterium]